MVQKPYRRAYFYFYFLLPYAPGLYYGFIFGAKLGAIGAAIAFDAAQGVTLALAAAYTLRRETQLKVRDPGAHLARAD